MADKIWDALSMRSNLREYYNKLMIQRRERFEKERKMCSLVELFNVCVDYWPSKTFMVPDSLVVERRDWGLELQSLRSYSPYDAINESDYYGLIQLESRLIYNEEDLSDIEWVELLFRSGKIPIYTYLYEFDTHKEKIISDEMFRYYKDFIITQAYYIYNGRYIPTKIHPEIILRNNLDELQVPRSVEKHLIEVMMSYPIFLTQEEAANIERVIAIHKVDRLELYDLLEVLYKECPEEYKISIKPSIVWNECFSLVVEDTQNDEIVDEVIGLFLELEIVINEDDVIDPTWGASLTLDLLNVPSSESEDSEESAKYCYSDVDNVLEFDSDSDWDES
jgi:hypothetical protein